MNVLKYFLFILLFAFCAKASVFDAEETRLDNGLRVIVSENHKAPIAKVMLWYKVGSMDETTGKSGLAHLLEHLMFRGTKTVPASKFNEIMHQNGVEFNAFTNTDFTVYHETTDISRLEAVLALEADRMTNLDISDEAFLGEQKIVLEERRQRIDNNPKSLFAEEVNQVLWQNTPYAHPVAGFESDINSLTKDDALDFYRRYYAPDNAVLVITGDITPSLGFKFAQKYFGHITKKSDIKKRPDKDFEAIVGGGNYLIAKELDDVKTTNITSYFTVPSILSHIKKAYALLIFSNYFGESKNSYLKRHLVETNKVIAASSNIYIYSRGVATFTAAAVPFEKAGVFDNFAILANILEQSVRDLTKDDVEKEKKKMLSSFVYVKDDPEDTAYFLGQMAGLGFSLEEIENHKKNIEDVTFEDVKKAALQMLKKSKRVMAVSSPKQKD